MANMGKFSESKLLDRIFVFLVFSCPFFFSFFPLFFSSLFVRSLTSLSVSCEEVD